jgi:endonuclease/exonuclease/phosphatase family metal-dependent hydrolase
MPILRVMTFNIHGNDAGWAAQRASQSLKILQRYSPDIIGLQEVEELNLEFYRDNLTGYGDELGLKYSEGATAAYCSILWKTDRFDRLEAGKFWFSRTPEAASSDWGVPHPLGAAWVRLQDKSTAAQFILLNTHFEYGPVYKQSHEESSRLILERVQLLAPNLPVIITGDFNANPWSVAYNNFQAGGFIDTYRAAGNADSVESSTFHAFKGQQFFALEAGEELFWRVDWILARSGARPLQTTSCTVVRDGAPANYPSDHYPVIAELAYY